MYRNGCRPQREFGRETHARAMNRLKARRIRNGWVAAQLRETAGAPIMKQAVSRNCSSTMPARIQWDTGKLGHTCAGEFHEEERSSEQPCNAGQAQHRDWAVAGRESVNADPSQPSKQ